MPTPSHLSNCLTLVPAPSSLSAAQRNSHGSATMAPGFGSGDPGMVGRSAAMQRLRLQIRRIGPHFRAVLLSGEPGTGKELVARELHGMSRGAAGPFVICDAATLECSAGEGGADTSSPDRIGWLMHVAREG